MDSELEFHIAARTDHLVAMGLDRAAASRQARRELGDPLRWKEQPLEFERTRKGWVMTRPQDVAYVKREVALQVLSARLSALARNTDPTPEQKDEQKEIIRLLNWLVVDDSRGAAAQNN